MAVLRGASLAAAHRFVGPLVLANITYTLLISFDYILPRRAAPRTVTFEIYEMILIFCCTLSFG